MDYFYHGTTIMIFYLLIFRDISTLSIYVDGVRTDNSLDFE